MELRKKGKWQIDWIKFIAVGIPMLYLAIYPLVHVFSYHTQGGELPLLNTLYRPPLHWYLPNKLSGVVLGYLLLTLPYKQTSSENSTTGNVE